MDKRISKRLAYKAWQETVKLDAQKLEDANNKKKDGCLKPAKTAYRRLRCDNCNFSTGSKTTLERHIEMMHNTIKEFMCANCDYVYTQDYDLKQHMRRFHKEKRKSQTSSELESEGKRSRKLYSYAERARVIKNVEEYKEQNGTASYRAMEVKLGVPHTSLQRWVQRKEEIFAKAEGDDSNRSQFKSRGKWLSCEECNFISGSKSAMQKHMTEMHDRTMSDTQKQQSGPKEENLEYDWVDDSQEMDPGVQHDWKEEKKYGNSAEEAPVSCFGAKVGSLGRRSVKSYSYAERASIIKNVEEYMDQNGIASYRAIEVKFGVPHSTLQRWIQKKEEIFAKAEDGSINSKIKSRGKWLSCKECNFKTVFSLRRHVMEMHGGIISGKSDHLKQNSEPKEEKFRYEWVDESQEIDPGAQHDWKEEEKYGNSAEEAPVSCFEAKDALDKLKKFLLQSEIGETGDIHCMNLSDMTEFVNARTTISSLKKSMNMKFE